MKEKLMKQLALSEKGASDLMKAGFWSFMNNLFLMFSSGIIYRFLKDTVDEV